MNRMGIQHYIFLAAISIMSLVGAILTVHDKRAAKRHARRVPERTLLSVGFFGGALVMLVTMLIIRHKTRHAKFMILLPVFALVHAAIGIWLFL